MNEGLILLDKPSGLTSHDCVARVRKRLPRKTKVGHAGTLDPFSTGLLVLLVGRGTRLAYLMQGMDKTYEGVLRFGESRDTFDRDGAVTGTGPIPELQKEEWQSFANRFIGRQMQVPPGFSAKRVKGQRAYELARQGISVPLEPKMVEVYEFKVEPVSQSDIRFRLGCSSGTYVRAIARDMGEVVGSPAFCLELCRTTVGPFAIGGANSLEDPFSAAGFIPFDSIDLGLPVHRANHREERLVLSGQKIPAPLHLQGVQGFVKIAGPSGGFLAIAKAETRQLQPLTVFHPPQGDPAEREQPPEPVQP